LDKKRETRATSCRVCIFFAFFREFISCRICIYFLAFFRVFVVFGGLFHVVAMILNLIERHLLSLTLSTNFHFFRILFITVLILSNYLIYLSVLCLLCQQIFAFSGFYLS